MIRAMGPGPTCAIAGKHETRTPTSLSSMFVMTEERLDHRGPAIRKALKTLVKECVWAALNRHTPRRTPIWIFGSRRSGSTLLMQVIAANRGVKYSDQALSVLSLSSYDVCLVPDFENGLFLELYPSLEQQLRSYFGAIMEGRHHVNEQWRPWARDFHFVSDRIVFKLLDGQILADWFEQEMGGDAIYLVRHPLSQVSSTLRNGWGCRHHTYLRTPSFTDKYLSASALQTCLKIEEAGSLLEQHVLTWCCENVHLIKQIDARPERAFISYEDIVLRPEEIIEALSNAYGLTDVKRMHAAANTVSISSRGRNTTEETRRGIVTGDREAVVSRWRRHFSPEEERKAFEILGLFDLDLYRFGEDVAVRPSRLPLPTCVN